MHTIASKVAGKVIRVLQVCRRTQLFSSSCASNMEHSNIHKRRREDGDAFLKETLPRLLKKVYESYKDRDAKVLEFVQPEEMKSRFNLKLEENPTTNEELEKLAENVIKYSLKTGHPYFFNPLWQGVDEFAVSAAMLNESLNAMAYTFEIAPVVTMMELELIQKAGVELFGYPQTDGVFCPGGSLGNIMAISMARYRKWPQCKEKGNRVIPSPVRIFTSETSHYSILKGAFFMGFGMESVIKVKCDSVGRMIPEELQKAIKMSIDEGCVPLMVNGTSGTTVFGSYDPLDKIADICAEHGIWFHVDACWGGSVMFSDKLKWRMAGIERTDSVMWDPHKMLGSILQCAVLLTKHVGLLGEAHNTCAQYLFQQDKIYDVTYDTGDKSLQCGRKTDAFKLWMQWKAYGSRGLAQLVETLFDNAEYFKDQVAKEPGFKLLFSDLQSVNICFWYIPKRLRGKEENDEWWQQVSKVAPAIKGEMQKRGTMMIQYQPQGNEYVNFFRMITSNPTTTHDDLNHAIKLIAEYGEELFPSE